MSFNSINFATQNSLSLRNKSDPMTLRAKGSPAATFTNSIDTLASSSGGLSVPKACLLKS
ncbi:hypothetical protein LINPERPRIM_LOCUS11920 [Linum perenne]